MNDFGKTLTDKIKLRQPTCPWWFLFTFDNPLRKIYQDPIKILAPYLKSGDIVLDLGCGMGYFSVPMARLVGDAGKVIAVDLQARMLAGVQRRAETMGLAERISTHQCDQDRIGITAKVDFALAFWMVHEVHDSRSFLEQVREQLVSGGHLFIAEPFVHVSRKAFEQIRSEISSAGLIVIGYPSVGFSRTILAKKE
jgi:ubiquinone/menaquinone biosynthesis C-methylase UbiE